MVAPPMIVTSEQLGEIISIIGDSLEALASELDLPVEGRLTICNLSVELGAKMGLIAPDETTFDYIRGRPYAPQGAMWEQAVAAWGETGSGPLVLDCKVNPAVRSERLQEAFRSH